jgi:hypothetical protein
VCKDTNIFLCSVFFSFYVGICPEVVNDKLYKCEMYNCIIAKMEFPKRKRAGSKRVKL